MTKDELQAATAMALDPNCKLSAVDDSIFWGFGLEHFEPVNVTIRQVAKLIRWQAVMLNGELHAGMYNEVAIAARRKFMITG